MAQRLRQRCMVLILLFNIFSYFATVLFDALQRISENAGVLANRVRLEEQRARVGLETALKCEQLGVWGVLYAHDACIVSRSSRGFELMMTVLVDVFGAFGLTISENKTETMCVPTPYTPATSIVFNRSGVQYSQTISFVYLGCAVTESSNPSLKVYRHICAGLMSFSRYRRELYDRPMTSLLSLEV